MLRLVLKFNNKILRELEIDGNEISIGRNADNDIQIDSMAVSGKHARIIKSPDQYIIEDLNSTNGTFVNEERVSRKVLKKNDSVTIGKHSLIVASQKHKDKEMVNELERTMKLETEKYREILRKQH